MLFQQISFNSLYGQVGYNDPYYGYRQQSVVGYDDVQNNYNKKYDPPAGYGRPDGGGYASKGGQRGWRGFGVGAYGGKQNNNRNRFGVKY